MSLANLIIVITVNMLDIVSTLRLWKIYVLIDV